MDVYLVSYGLRDCEHRHQSLDTKAPATDVIDGAGGKTNGPPPIFSSGVSSRAPNGIP